MQGSGGFLNTNQHAGPPHYTIGVTTESRTKKMRNATLLKKIILRKQDHRILYHKESGKRFVASLDDKRKIENEEQPSPFKSFKEETADLSFDSIPLRLHLPLFRQSSARATPYPPVGPRLFLLRRPGYASCGSVAAPGGSNLQRFPQDPWRSSGPAC